MRLGSFDSYGQLKNIALIFIFITWAPSRTVCIIGVNNVSPLGKD